MGKPHASVIELNGKVYDLKAGHSQSHTGQTHHSTQSTTHTTMPKSTPKPIHVTDGQALDSVVRRRPHPAHNPAAPALKKVQRSKTLMRSVVHKPQPTKTTKQTGVEKPVIINSTRIARAAHVHKSHLISRFGPKHATSIAPQLTPLAVQPEPEQVPRPAVLNDHFNKAVLHIPKGHVVSHANPFENALAHATSHTQPQPKKPNRSQRLAKRTHTTSKKVRMVGVLILLLGIGGFFVHQNITKFAMRLAATRAGINAKLPNYQPPGFSMKDSIEYSPGQIQVSYKSNSDDRGFTIIQKVSEPGAALKPSDVLGLNTTFQTVESGGKTIYINDQRKATWEANGIQYQIDGSGLTNDQLLKLANSF